MPDTTNNASPQDSFIKAFTESQSALRGFCLASLGNADDAAEVFQKASLVLWKKANQWDPDSSFLKWAFSVVRFEILGHLRDRSRERLVFDDDVVQAMVATAERRAGSQPERVEALEDCLEKLKPQHRETLSAYYVKGLKMKELAEQQNRGVSAVKVMMMRLRQLLAKCIDQVLADPV